MLNVNNEFRGQIEVILIDSSVSLIASRQCQGLSSMVHNHYVILVLLL